MTVSDEAKNWLVCNLKGEDFIGIKVKVNQKGCAGGEYEFSPVKNSDDVRDCDKSEHNDMVIFFPRMDLLKLIGAELVLTQDGFNTRLDFRNPNEDSRCGGGESVSFNVNR